MISFFAIKYFGILLIVNQILADQCVQKNSCECNYDDGFGYDLHGLETPNKTNFEANSTSNTNITYIFRPCSDSTVLPDHRPILQNDCNAGFAVCLYNATAQTFSLLAKNKDAALKVNTDGTVYLVYSYDTQGKKISTTISLVCTNVEHDYFFESFDSSDPNVHNLLLFTKQACKQELFTVSTLSTGAVLNITFLVIVFAYLTIGVAVDYFLMGARGIEVIPHLAFWKDFPFLVRDGIKFVQNGCKIQPSDLSENRDIYTSI